MEKSEYTFWQLINQCTIEIPTIQRDYTYGRSSAREISTNLIESILNTLKSNDDILHLDFVYGKKLGVENFNALERNKNSIDTLLFSLKSYAENLNIEVDFNTQEKHNTAADVITFIPLDGQQRLTTLFLVYWFVANILKDEQAKEKLQRFKYATRSSSKEFLQFLTNENHHFDWENGSISESIQDHEEFYTKWEKDPTVSSMLIVLDEIQKQFLCKELNVEDVWRKLSTEEKVTFDFFDLDDFQLTDELYLKMNARGKKLTNFEKFKAWLLRNYQNNIEIENWNKKLDLQWNDLFWNAKKIGDSKIDSAYLHFFNNMYLGNYLLDETISDKDENIDLLRLSDQFNPISLFNQNPIFKENINDYLKVLECFSNEDVNVRFNPAYKISSNKIDQYIFSGNGTTTWWHTTFYFAITRYIINHKDNLAFLPQWNRVISNLIYNTPIESPKLFREATVSILNLIEKVKDKNVYEVFASFQTGDIQFFNEKQRQEEIKKCKIIIEEPTNDWEELFIKLEDHNCFYGQIGFIFNLNKTIDFHNFEEIAKKVSILFSEKVMANSNYLLFRSLLTFGDCFFKRNNTLTYPANIMGTLRNRNENWRRFFDTKLDFVQKIVEVINPNQDIEKQLNDIIENYINDSTNISKLIKNAKLLQYPEKNHIRIYDKGYYLLSKTRIYGFFKEVQTYDWYTENKLFCRDNSITYEDGKGEDHNPGIFIKKIKKKIIIDWKSLKFRFEDETILFDTIEEILKLQVNA